MITRTLLSLGACTLLACSSSSHGDDASNASATHGESAAGAGGEAAAQAGAGGAPALAPCDPLASVTSSVVLSSTEIIDAGSDAAGAVYVLVDGSNGLRLFVSDGATLEEQPELGTGQGTQDGTQFWTFSYSDATGTMLTVEVEDDGSGKQMGLVTGALPAKTFTVGDLGTVLTPLDAATAAAMPAETTTTPTLVFSGTLDDGRDLVLTEPVGPSEFQGFRAFLGPPDAVAEQTVVSVNTSLGWGGPTDVSLLLGGATASFIYGSSMAVLSTGSSSADVTPAALTGEVFLCR